MKKLLILTTASLVIGCGKESYREEIVLPPVPVFQMDTTSVPGCTVMRSAKDTNYNGQWDLADGAQQQSMICNGAPGQNGTSCSVSDEMAGGVKLGSRIACSDGSYSVILNGDKGDKGDNAEPCTVSTMPAIPIIAPNGGVAISCPGQLLPRIVHNGKNGLDGKDGASIGMISSSATVAQCSAGGTMLQFYKDANNSGSKQASEPVLNTTVVCNGTNGTNGVNGVSSSISTQALLSGNTQCPYGGLEITTTTGSSSIVDYVCNGVAGANGADGADGVDGVDGKTAYELAVENGFAGTLTDWLASLMGPKGDDGEAGAIGPMGPQGPQGPTANVTSSSGLTPLKLCPGDNSAFPEYGFIIGTDLYAVYYGVIAGSQQAFLAKLNNGSYVTTNGAGCQFKVSHNSDGDLLINDTVVVTATNLSSGLLVFDAEVSRTTGIYDNAEVVVRFKNVSNLTLSKFKVTIAGVTSGGVIRSGSSLVSPGGNVLAYTSQNITFLTTNTGGIAPDGTVTVKILYTKLGNESLTFGVEAL